MNRSPRNRWRKPREAVRDVENAGGALLSIALSCALLALWDTLCVLWPRTPRLPWMQPSLGMAVWLAVAAGALELLSWWIRGW